MGIRQGKNQESTDREVVDGQLKVGINDSCDVVILLPVEYCAGADKGVNLLFTPSQAISLGLSLIRHASRAVVQQGQAEGRAGGGRGESKLVHENGEDT